MYHHRREHPRADALGLAGIPERLASTRIAARIVGCNLECLVLVRAVEIEDVVAVLAADRVATIARHPNGTASPRPMSAEPSRRLAVGR
jgi:hypothetical protein